MLNLLVSMACPPYRLVVCDGFERNGDMACLWSCWRGTGIGGAWQLRGGLWLGFGAHADPEHHHWFSQLALRQAWLCKA